MKDMSKSELIELVAATFFRVQAALSVFWALKDLLGSIPASYALWSMSSLSGSKQQVLNESIHRMILASFFGSIASLVTAALLFFLAVPLARLLLAAFLKLWNQDTQINPLLSCPSCSSCLNRLASNPVNLVNPV